MGNTGLNGTRDSGLGTREKQRTAPPVIDVAAGCLINPKGEVLICQRPAHKIYSGEWEFPGGKIEAGEAAEAALARELREELGITVRACRPLIRLRHDYPELSIALDVWRVTDYTGEVQSGEHPAVAWVAPEELPDWTLLAADRPIVTALRLPEHYVFTPPELPVAAWCEGMQRLPPDALLRLRRPALDDAAYARLAARLAPQCRNLRLGLMLDRAPERVEALNAAGLHLSAAQMRKMPRLPQLPGRWRAASCHTAAELRQAVTLGVDFAVLGPVRATATHPGFPGLGWDSFARIARGAGVPVYAIGGLGPGDLAAAWTHGAQGVSGISAFWTTA